MIPRFCTVCAKRLERLGEVCSRDCAEDASHRIIALRDEAVGGGDAMWTKDTLMASLLRHIEAVTDGKIRGELVDFRDIVKAHPYDDVRVFTSVIKQIEDGWVPCYVRDLSGQVIGVTRGLAQHPQCNCCVNLRIGNEDVRAVVLETAIRGARTARLYAVTGGRLDGLRVVNLYEGPRLVIGWSMTAHVTEADDDFHRAVAYIEDCP